MTSHPPHLPNTGYVNAPRVDPFLLTHPPPAHLHPKECNSGGITPSPSLSYTTIIPPDSFPLIPVV